jgi:hypothetical protein
MKGSATLSLIAASLLLRSAAAACDSTELCCSLSGAYSGGGCACRAPWSGPNCSSLDILPAQPFPQGFGVAPNHTTWGGNIVRGADGLYHLFVAEMVNNCSLAAWETNSRCVHATSPKPDGPFEFSDVAVDVYCHNPQIVQYDSGFALFHIGLGAGGDPVNCSASAFDVYGASLPVAPAAASGSSLHLSSSLSGPWEPVIQGAPPGCNNPAPARHPNNTWFLVCDSRQVFRLDDADASGAPVGNWTQVAQLVPDANAVKGSYEDAFLFFDDQEPPNWHVLFHIWTSLTNITSCVDTTVSGLAFSRDGLEWGFSEVQPYGSEVVFADGSNATAPTLERPKLVFDENRRPTHLVNGACGGASSCLPHWCSRCKQLFWDFTLVRPLATS